MVSQNTDLLRQLQRGEIAATETYQQAIASIEDTSHPGVSRLRQIHDEHREAAATLKQHIRAEGDAPEHGSGAWGAFAKSVEGVAAVFGNTSALKALKEGEESGLHSYEDAIADTSLPVECRNLIETRLLPQTRSHIQVLDELMSQR